MKCFFFQIAKYGLSVALVFFVTLAAFPSLTSRIQSVNKADKSEWTSKRKFHVVFLVWCEYCPYYYAY